MSIWHVIRVSQICLVRVAIMRLCESFLLFSVPENRRFAIRKIWCFVSQMIHLFVECRRERNGHFVTEIRDSRRRNNTWRHSGSSGGGYVTTQRTSISHTHDGYQMIRHNITIHEAIILCLWMVGYYPGNLFSQSWEKGLREICTRPTGCEFFRIMRVGSHLRLCDYADRWRQKKILA